MLIGLHLGLGLQSTAAIGGLVPPPGFVFLIDDDGATIVDDDGAYLMEPA